MKRTALLTAALATAAFAAPAVAQSRHQWQRGTDPIVVGGSRPDTGVINSDGGGRTQPPRPTPPAPTRTIITPGPTGPTSIPPMRTPTGPVVLAGTSGHRGPTTVVTPTPPSSRATTFVTDYRTPVSSPPRVADALSRPVTVSFRDRARGIMLTVVTTERGVPAAMARYRDWEYVATTPAK